MPIRVRSFAARLGLIAVALGAALLPPSFARSQEMRATGAPPSDLTFAVSPYLWIAGISGSVTTPLQAVPAQDISVSFGDTLSNLSGLAFMGTGEIRHRRFGLLFDIMTLRVESDITPSPGILFSGGTGRVTTTMGSVISTYRVFEGSTETLDLGAGFRPWSIDVRLSLDAGALPGRTLRPSASWVDPLLALRYTRRIGDGWSASFYGDVGGFGAGSELTWQALGTVNYAWSDRVDLRVGYRHMQVEHRKAGTEIDLGLSGPILAATFRF